MPTKTTLRWKPAARFPGMPPGVVYTEMPAGGEVTLYPPAYIAPGSDRWEVSFTMPDGARVCLLTELTSEAACREWVESQAHRLTPTAIAARLKG